MVETRRGKAKRVALDLANHRTNAQAENSFLINLPVEIRYMIYKYVWTPTMLPWEYDIQAQRSGQPYRDHMKQIHILTSVCRHMRYEVIAEYFHRTQAHVTHCVGGFGYQSDERIIASMQHIKASVLFTENLCHVGLNWFSDNREHNWICWALCMNDNAANFLAAQQNFFVRQHIVLPFGLKTQKPGKQLRQVDTFKWLASLKSLKTLQIGFMDVLHGNGVPMFFGPDAPNSLISAPELEGLREVP